MQRKRLSYCREELSGSELIEREIQSPGRRARDKRGQSLPKHEDTKKLEVVRFKTERAGNGGLPVAPKIKSLVHLNPIQIPSRVSGVSSPGLYPARCNNHSS